MSGLRPPRYLKGPRTWHEFASQMDLLKTPVFIGFWLIGAAFIASFLGANSWVKGGVFWAVGSIFVLFVYFAGCSDKRQSMVRIPWYKPWALLLLLVTLPWLPLWLLSLARLIISDPRKDLYKSQPAQH